MSAGVVLVEALVAAFLVVVIDWTRVRQRVALHLALAGIRLVIASCGLKARQRPTWRPISLVGLWILLLARVVAVR